MEFRPFKILNLLIALVLVAGLGACSSDDDPTDPGGGGPGDTTAPKVNFVFPEDGELMLISPDAVMVEFDETMDPTSATGQVTLSHGTIDAVDWIGDSSLMVSYSNLPQATRITLTLGTGLKDVAGNGLKAPVALNYGSWSDNLALFEMTPSGGATDINRSSSIILDFVDRLDQGDVLSEITISDPTKANLPFEVGTSNGSTWILNPAEDLPGNSEITVTIGTGVTSEQGVSFPEPYSFSFTTNDQTDNTPPTIVSFDPDSGSTMPIDQQTLTITFSEPINPDRFKPVSMNGQLQWLIGQAPSEPSWNAGLDVLTVPLPALPAGLSLEAVFANYEDLVGNVQTAETPWSVTVAGNAEMYPVHDGMRYMMIGEWAEGDLGSEVPNQSGEEWIWFQLTARPNAGDWNLEEYNDPGYSVLDYYDIQRVNADALSLIGFAEEDGGSFTEFMLSTPATWADLPFQAGKTWSQNLSVNTPEGTIDVALAGEVVGMADLPLEEIDGIAFTWTDVWHVRLDLDIGQGGDVFTHEVNEIWYAPGVGAVRSRYSEENLETGNTGWSRHDRWLSLWDN